MQKDTLKFLITLFVLLSSSLMMSGEDSTKKEDVDNQTIFLNLKSDRSKRPRAPQRHSSVECYYQDGVITIEFETAEGDATFTVTDVVTGDNASTMFNTAMEFNYFIGSEPSTYLLEISTSEGNNYEGYLTID